MEYRLTTPLTREALAPLRKGDLVYLSGVIYTARDAAHKRLVALAKEGKALPFPIENATIYYVGPTPAKPGQVIGSAGPTTSYRMDAYSPTLIALGETGMIGKGRRSQEVIDAMKAHGAVYFGAIGGAGALLARCIKKAEIVAYEDLGAEAVRRLEVEDMPLVVVIDSLGGNLYETGRADYLGKPREEMKLWTQSAYPEYHKRDTPWDPMAWRSAFLCTHDKHKIRRVVYASTLQAVEERGYTLPDGRHIPLALDPDMDRESKLYAKELHPAPPEVVKDTVVEVVDRDCLAVAKELLEAQLGRVAVLNMANRQTPGGGVYGGSGAQEEYCFRCSDYFRSLYQYSPFGDMYGVSPVEDQYPMDRDFGGCYSPNVTIFRGLEEEGYPFLEKTWKMNFIAVAALNRPETVTTPEGDRHLIHALVEPAKRKMRTIFNIAIENGVEVLVLGAMGCGAFRNPPEHIAALFKEVLDEPPYKGRFVKIVFAIKGDHNSMASRRYGSLVDTFSAILTPNKK